MITTLGKYISNNLSCKVRQSNYFPILTDKAADISNKELSVVIRFVDSGKNIREEFVGFYMREGGTAGVAIKEHILQASADLRGYQWMIAEDSVMMDGTGNMAERLSGASSLIRQAHEKAIYVHCMNHRLNLCVADTCSLALVSTMMNVVRALSVFFNNSPKRQQCLIAKIRELLLNNNHHVLIDVCRTRWISRIKRYGQDC